MKLCFAGAELYKDDLPCFCSERRTQSFEVGVETVSYTHLDVYKRQVEPS